MLTESEKQRGRIYEAKFIKRKNRFSALVNIEGKTVDVHVPNSGRMGELLVEGAPILLRYAAKTERKTDFDLIKVYYKQGWVSIDSRLPNLLFIDSVKKGNLGRFKNYSFYRKEVTYKDSRLDVVLEHDVSGEYYYIELKSVTLVEDGVARFPDAPTKRGTRHLLTLQQIVEDGQKAGVIFIVQRGDASCFKPNVVTDPLFSETLSRVKDSGVDIYAYRCKVDKNDIKIVEPIRIDLGGCL